MVVYAVGDVFSKKFATDPTLALGCFAVLAYSGASALWLSALLEKNQLAIVGPIWSVSSMIVTVLIGVLLFGENLSLVTIAGIILGAISIGLLALS